MEKVYFREEPQQVSVVRELGGWRTDVVMDIRKLAGDELETARDDGLLGDDEEDLWTGVSVLTLHHDTPLTDAEKVKKAIVDYIDARTDERILSGFVWNGVKVWLSAENQRNFSEGQRAAMITSGQSLPITFKLGQDSEGRPAYHEFTTIEELTGFYLQAVAYINQCLVDGWAKKDAACAALTD